MWKANVWECDQAELEVEVNICEVPNKERRRRMVLFSMHCLAKPHMDHDINIQEVGNLEKTLRITFCEFTCST